MYNPGYMPYYGMSQQRMAQMEQQYPQFQQNNVPTMQPIPQQNVAWIPVSGIQGAKDHIVQPGQTAWLMDNNSMRFYVKTSDSLGVTNLKAFQFSEIGLEQTPQPVADTSQYVQRVEFEELKAKLEELAAMQIKRPAKANKEEKDNG